MKNIKILQLLALSLCAVSTYAGIEYSTLKVRGSAFFPQSKRVRQIYGKVGGNAEIEAAIGFTDHVALWANFDWFSKHGHSTGLLQSRTNVKIANFSFGLQFPWQIDECIILYAGVGPTIAKIWLRNVINTTAQTIVQNVSKTCVGGIVKTGIYWFFYDNFFCDTFADYLYQPTGFSSKANVGGVRLGLGLGVMF